MTPNGTEGSGSAEEHPEGERTVAEGFPHSWGGVAGPASQIPHTHIPKRIPGFPVLVSLQLMFVRIIN